VALPGPMAQAITVRAFGAETQVLPMSIGIVANKKGFQSKLIGSPATGRDAEIRTRDLTHPKGARYQAAPRPVKPLLVSMEKLCNANC
jgi:hypothetical protein